jgi:CheY-like chemotaxis protein
MAVDGARHVLVVDDEAIAALALAHFLRRRGYRVTTAGDGLQALDVHAADPADAVITDIRMPRIDGGELIRRLHDDDPTLPIIVITGYISFLDEEETRKLGAALILKKPVSLREIVDELGRLLEARAA